MAARKVTARTIGAWSKYFELVNAGMGLAEACKISRVSQSAAYRFKKGDLTCEGFEVAAHLGITMVEGKEVPRPLTPEAQRALSDFEYFRLRYLGRKSMPWQVKAAGEVLRAYQSPNEEYVVINCPPGAGKSTLFTSDIALWLIAIDRAIRVQIGSRTMSQAEEYVTRIRRTLERTSPIQASLKELKAGAAFDAEGCMAEDFGVFKPPNRTEKWTAQSFTVRPLDGVPVEDKEATVTAIAQDEGFLGKRCNIVFWDDLSDAKNTRTEQARRRTIDWFDTQAETRIEPGGVVVVIGQRIASNDLYSYLLSKREPDETPTYRHIIYKAHYDELCTGNHDNIKEAWPKSCLLDPIRLAWSKLQSKRNNNQKVFDVQYQQEDSEVIGAVVQKAWIHGGPDDQDFDAPGCLDKARHLDEPPFHMLDRPNWSFITCDPAQSTGWWAPIWWLYDPETERRYIINHYRRRMTQNDWLTADIDHVSQLGLAAYSGVLEDIRIKSLQLGIPVTTLIFEANAAQNWFRKMPHVKKWMDLTGIEIIDHQTQRNKADATYGVESLGDDFRQGLIRIPWTDMPARNKMSDFITEVLKYPEYDTTDLFMSAWFARLGVQNYYTPPKVKLPRRNVPSHLFTSTNRGIW